MSEASLLLMEQACIITRLHVLLRRLCAQVGNMIDGSPMDLSQETLVNELATGLLRDSLAVKAINREMIERWVAQVLAEQEKTSGAKEAAS
jgi:hypothetical protein